MRDTGGRAVDLNGSVRLSDGPGGSSSGPFRAQKIVTLAPGQSWNMAFLLPRSLPDGSWRAAISVVSGMTQATGTATVRFGPPVTAQAGFSAMQWAWLALGGLALILVLALVIRRLASSRRYG